MKKQKLNIYQLNNLNVEEKLREMGYKELYIRKQSIKYHYLITQILNKYFYFSRDYNNGYVKIYGELLADDIGHAVDVDGKSKDIVYSIRRHLKEWGVILFHKHEKGDHDNGHFDSEVYYKITDEFYKGGYKLISDNELIEKLNSNRIKQRKKKKYNEKILKRKHGVTGIYKHLESIYSKIKLDEIGASETLTNALNNGSKLSTKRVKGKVTERHMDKATESFYQMFIDRFNQDKFFHIDFNTGRVYSALTTLPKMFRKHLSIDGESFTELDIGNSQPLLLSILYRKWCDYNNIEIQKDGEEYQLLCETANFYSFFKDYVEKNKVKTYDTFKTDVFARIFFNKDKKKENSYQRLFKKQFPSVYACISDIKKHNHKDVAFRLQSIEADLIINKISTRLVEEGIESFFTIHDSINVLEKDKKRTHEIMLEEFAKVELRPTIKEK